jgi:hypothetical protein
MALTDVAVRQARPRPKEYKLSDERGLLLLVGPNGRKGWRLRYKFEGREKMLSFGTYPEVSLSMARERRDAARRLSQAASIRVPSARRGTPPEKPRHRVPSASSAGTTFSRS